MTSEHLVVAIAKREIVLLRRVGVLALYPGKVGRGLRARAQRIHMIDGERYELVVDVLSAMTAISGVVLAVAWATASVAPHHPAVWRPVFGAVIASVAFHAVLVTSIIIRIGVRRNPVWPAGNLLVLQAGSLALLIGLSIAFG